MALRRKAAASFTRCSWVVEDGTSPEKPPSWSFVIGAAGCVAVARG